MTGSPSTFIKGEPEDYDFNSNKFSGGFNSMNPNFGHHYPNNNNHNTNDMGGVNPSDLAVNGNMIHGQFGSHMSNSFVGDDELLDLTIEDQNSHFNNNFNGFSNNEQPQNQQFGGSIQINQQMYSHTPDTNPIASPFANDFNFGHSYPQVNGRAGFSQSIPTAMGMPNGSFKRQPSDSRSPMTPRTPHMNHLGGTPESLQQQAMLNQQLHNQARMASNHYIGSGSAQSWDDDSLPSPHSMHMQHPQISEIIATGKHASMPAKMENGGMPPLQSQEAKKKRRRESHNAVERRRRDNINERIGELSKLVPAHRLEDEKVKKHISNNGPLSPAFGAAGISPPHATSLLAGGTGRRAAGNITQGLPMEDKDKGPNKGDILNGSVAWVRDMMWLLHLKLKQEQELKAYIERLGGTWPLEESIDEKYMRTEIVDSVEKNGEHNFHYSRHPGSGLRVPKHTNIAGEPVSPGHQSSQSPGSATGHNQSSYWSGNSNNGRGSFSLKEEDEFGMDMG